MTREERLEIVAEIRQRAIERSAKLDQLGEESMRIQNRLSAMQREREQLLADLETDAQLLESLAQNR